MPESTDVERGARMREVREALDLDQGPFAQRLSAMAASLGLSATYTALGVSQRETGRRALDANDYAVLTFLDPSKRTWMWLAFGRELSVAKRGIKVADLVAPKRGTG